jgi:flagellar biosynthesis protein FlhG
VLLGDKFLEDICISTAPNTWLVPSYRGIQELSEKPDRFNRLRANLQRLPVDADILLATLPTGAIDLAFQMSEHHTKWLWVVTPTPHSVTSVYTALKAAAGRFSTIQHRIVVTYANSADEADHVFSNLTDACQRFLSVPLEYGGFLPSSKVSNVVRGGYSDSLHGGLATKYLDFDNVGLRVAKAMMSRTNMSALA